MIVNEAAGLTRRPHHSELLPGFEGVADPDQPTVGVGRQLREVEMDGRDAVRLVAVEDDRVGQLVTDDDVVAVRAVPANVDDRTVTGRDERHVEAGLKSPVFGAMMTTAEIRVRHVELLRDVEAVAVVLRRVNTVAEGVSEAVRDHGGTPLRFTSVPDGAQRRVD